MEEKLDKYLTKFQHYAERTLHEHVMRPLICVHADLTIPVWFVTYIYGKQILLLSGLGFASLVLLILLFPLVLVGGMILAMTFCVNMWKSTPCKPNMIGDHQFVAGLLEACPSLHEVYKPPALWGRSGICQTVMLFIIGRQSWKLPKWERRTHVVSDGATIYFDILHPKTTNPTGAEVTIVIVPGLSNYSDTNYVRYLCLTAQQKGYRCLVFNHLGMIPGSKLTSTRIFGFGETSDFSEIVDLALREYPKSKIILLGFSMGGSTVTNYAGERGASIHPSICGVIAVQPAYRFQDLTMAQNPVQVLVSYLAAEMVKRYIMKNRTFTLPKEFKKKYDLDEDKINSAFVLKDVHEQYTRRISGKQSINEFYEEINPERYVNNVKVPIVLFNAEDDVGLPNAIKVVKPLVENRANTALIVTKHGGHLGYFNGGVVLPNEAPWVDGVVIEIATALVKKSLGSR